MTFMRRNAVASRESKLVWIDFQQLNVRYELRFVCVFKDVAAFFIVDFVPSKVKNLPCGLAKMVLKEQDRLEARLAKEELDPRLSSRSPGANSSLISRPRYLSSLNSCKHVLFEMRGSNVVGPCKTVKQNTLWLKKLI